ncbi:hypothetical protein SELMODRAFT_409985 [Selaginella moellendorffii]|uniref:Uncharacterized protein n=2 Tax=Selaginella moellendorffii TaxID=88036 RepID=D8RD36_SELML|nr:hypothetical protein SELMODRAFT_409985 [Selaginella moellendorffii]
MDDVFPIPVRLVYVHPAEERGRNVDDLRSKVAFRAVPFDIQDSAELASWLKTALTVDAVLTSKGWMEIPMPDPAPPLPPAFELHLRKALFADACDNSKEWARTVLRPFPFAVLGVADLRRALEEPLSLPLPVGPATYATLYPSSATQFIPTSQYPAERISACVTTFMNSRVAFGMSENQSFWDSAFCNLWMELLYLSEITSVQLNRSVTELSGASTADARPDLLLWISSRLCVKFEEKRATLEEAFQDLTKKLGVLPPQYYGPVQWMLGVALAGPEMAGWAVRHGQDAPDDLFGRLNMVSLRDKATCLRLSVNFLRIALTISDFYSGMNSLPRPFNVLPPASYGSLGQIARTLRIVYPKVIKEIRPWSQHVAEGFTTTALVTRAYGLGAVGLVSGDVKVRGERYSVVIHSVGYERIISRKDDLWPAMQDVLHGVHALHHAGLVHRDIRWRNVLQCPASNEGWMLIDLETVWKTDCKPSCCWLRAWDENTLVDGLYTRSSDLYLVGRLMESFRDLSPEAKEFRARLLRHGFRSAQEALHYLKNTTFCKT